MTVSFSLGQLGRLGAARRGERVPPYGVGEEREDRTGQGRGVAVTDQFRGPADQFAGTSGVGGDQRHPGPQRLLGDQRARLPPAGQYHQVGRGEEFGHIVATAEQLDGQLLDVDPPL